LLPSFPWRSSTPRASVPSSGSATLCLRKSGGPETSAKASSAEGSKEPLSLPPASPPLGFGRRRSLGAALEERTPRLRPIQLPRLTNHRTRSARCQRRHRRRRRDRRRPQRSSPGEALSSLCGLFSGCFCSGQLSANLV
jgi:hypothetical protein